MGWFVYFFIGFVFSFVFEPQDEDRTVGWVVAMTTMWPISLFVAIMRVRL